MSHRVAPRIALGLLLLAVLACSPALPNIPIVSTVQAAASQVGTLEAAATALSTLTSSVISAQATFAAATPVPTPVVPADSLLPAQLKANQLKLKGVTVNSSGTDFYGPIMQIEVTNPGTTDVVTNIPCGLIFMPTDNTQQRLMVLQPISGVVSANGSAPLTAFVDCIDDSKHAPPNAATYSIGDMSTGDLLKLAACTCGQPLAINSDINQEFGLIVAVWHTTDPQFPSQITSSLIGPALQPLMPLFLASANGWLSKCGLKTIS